MGLIDYAKWGKRAMAASDWAGNHANNVGAKFGTERFWPTSGDYKLELDKCERILRTFTVEGLPTEEETTTTDGQKKKRKVYRKIPPKVIQEAKGLIIFNAMRSGFAPFSGAGGGGIITVRMRDGQWSPPSFISPNNFAAGLMIGLDVYQCVLVLRTEQAVKGFRTHNLTIGSEIGVAAGPLGYGISGEAGLKSGAGFKAPIFSYVLSKGFFAGVEVVGQAFLDRFDENERVYWYPGIKAGDIFDGKVRRPAESDRLYAALRDAELGTAQGASLEWDTEEVTQTLDLGEGEVLKLPPTPEQLQAWESAGIKDEEDVKHEEEERKAVRSLPPPPRHPYARNSKARSSDASLLNGRTAGLRSPDMGYSSSQDPSQASSPTMPQTAQLESSSSYATAPDLSQVTSQKFLPPPKRNPARGGVTGSASPSGSGGRFVAPSTSVSTATTDDAGQEAAIEPLHVPAVHAPDGQTEETLIPEAQKQGLGLVLDAEKKEAGAQGEHVEVPAPDSSDMANLSLREDGGSAPEQLEIPQPPKLEHQDSEASFTSVYSEPQETSIPPPPAYQPGEGEQAGAGDSKQAVGP